MTLVAPDPIRAVPLPLREQAAVRDRWLTQRLLDVLPGLMDRAGIDLWLVVGREYNEDPVLATLLPATWLSARRRTILVLHRSDDGVTAAAVSRYPVGQFEPAWSPDEAPDVPAEASQWGEVRRIVDQAAPRRIGIDVSESFALADGLAHTEHRLLAEALGPWAEHLVPAEELAVGWLETRIPEEIAALRRLEPARPRRHRRGLLPRRHRRGDDDRAGPGLVVPPALPRPRCGPVVPAERGGAAGRRPAVGRAPAGGGVRRRDLSRRPRPLRRRVEQPLGEGDEVRRGDGAPGVLGGPSPQHGEEGRIADLPAQRLEGGPATVVGRRVEQRLRAGVARWRRPRTRRRPGSRRHVVEPAPGRSPRPGARPTATRRRWRTPR